MIEDMQEQSRAWWDAFDLDDSKWPFFHDSYLDVIDEFDATPFIAAHGWYRQAATGLRNALEVMTHACRYAIVSDSAGYTAWRSNTAEPKFGNSVDIIGLKPTGKAVDSQLSGAGLFGHNPNGVLRSLYADVCRYAHSQPGRAHSAALLAEHGVRHVVTLMSRRCHAFVRACMHGFMWTCTGTAAPWRHPVQADHRQPVRQRHQLEHRQLQQDPDLAVHRQHGP